MELHTIGIDLGKTVFHLVGLNQRGEAVVRKKFSRAQLLRFTANLKVDLIGMEACGGSHFLGRALRTKYLTLPIGETLSYYSLPPEHWRCLRTNNPLERLMREIRRRTRVVGAFPDGNSALMLVAARLRHVAATKWGTKRYLQMSRLAELVAIA